MAKDGLQLAKIEEESKRESLYLVADRMEGGSP